MPQEYPDYPDHAQALAYLRAYARRIRAVRPHSLRADGRARRADGRRRVARCRSPAERHGRMRALIVASGIHWVPIMPRVPGTFEGDCMHSCGYKSPEIFRGKRVLVVGAGNSGCDIAVDACRARRANLPERASRLPLHSEVRLRAADRPGRRAESQAPAATPRPASSQRACAQDGGRRAGGVRAAAARPPAAREPSDRELEDPARDPPRRAAT